MLDTWNNESTLLKKGVSYVMMMLNSARHDYGYGETIFCGN